MYIKEWDNGVHCMQVLICCFDCDVYLARSLADNQKSVTLLNRHSTCNMDEVMNENPIGNDTNMSGLWLLE